MHAMDVVAVKPNLIKAEAAVELRSPKATGSRVELRAGFFCNNLRQIRRDCRRTKKPRVLVRQDFDKLCQANE